MALVETCFSVVVFIVVVLLFFCGFFFFIYLKYPFSSFKIKSMRYYFIITKYLMIAWCLFRYLTGQVDKRTLEKYEREAKEKNRETWLVY